MVKNREVEFVLEELGTVWLDLNVFSKLLGGVISLFA